MWKAFPRGVRKEGLLMIIKGVGIYGGLVDWLRLFEAGKKFSKLSPVRSVYVISCS
jgi:hypothetical protein